MILTNVIYKIKEGQRDNFIEAAKGIDLFGNTRNEAGNISYDYFFPIDDPDGILCVEKWESEEFFAAHRDQAHVIKFQEIKKDYVLDMSPEMFVVEKK